MALKWDSTRNMMVDDGAAPSQEVKAVVQTVDAIGGAVFDAFGLNALTELIRKQWQNAGYLDKKDGDQ